MIKKLILLGFGLTLLIGLPLAIFVLQNQTQPTTGAAPVTKFSFSGAKQVDAGANFDENLVVDPGGSNQVSFVKFTFTYDPNFIDKQATPVTIDTNTYTVLQAPSVDCSSGTLCTVTATLSVGSNQNAIIKSATTVAVIHLVAKANTDANGTQLAFVAGQNQALSVGTSDQAAENVFQTGVPATIVIGSTGSGGGSGTPTDTVSPTGSGGGGGTGGGGGGGGTGGGANGGVSVSCDSFTADKTSGNTPLTVTFTTVGSSSTDSITQLDLNYGDGSTDIVATGSGLGTGNINNQISHVYNNNGAFNAYAVLTTSSGATSSTTNCTQTITVGQVAQASSSSKGLPPTGPGQTFVLLGVAGAILTAVGLVIVAGL